MVERAVIHELLDALRFDEAEALIDQDGDPELQAEVSRRRALAEERARDLRQRIAALAEERAQADLAAMARDTATRRLLALLPVASRKAAEVRLREAERWEAQRKETHTRRLAEARRALDGLDLEMARGLMNRIDGRFLSEEQVEDRDRLLLEISARAQEVESLAESGRRLISESRPKPQTRKRSWWRRWLG